MWGVLWCFVLMVLMGCDERIEEPLVQTRHVVCWSGGVKIYEGDSVGKVWTWTGGTLHDFDEAPSGRPLLVSGDCVIAPREE